VVELMWNVEGTFRKFEKFQVSFIGDWGWILRLLNLRLGLVLKILRLSLVWKILRLGFVLKLI
jgi:hypothetical protein